MGLFTRKPKTPPVVEWQGPELTVTLEPRRVEGRERFMAGRSLKNVWVTLRPTANKQGRTKIDVMVDGRWIIGNVPAAALQKNPAIADAILRARVNVGVVRLDSNHGQDVPTAELVLGRGYKYRPKALWD